MKKLLVAILILFSFLGLSYKSQAQTEFSIGPRAGIAFSTYKLNFPFYEARMRRGFTGGLYARITRNEIFFFEPGLQITSKGAIISAPDIASLDSFPTTEFVSTYMDIPLLIGIQPSENFFLVKTGLQFSNLMSAYRRAEGTNTQIKEFYNDWDIAFVMELAYEFDFGLNVATRFSNGISNLRRETNIPPGNSFNQRDNFSSFSMMIMVGYDIPLKSAF